MSKSKIIQEKISNFLQLFTYALLTACAVWWLYCALTDTSISGIISKLENNSRILLLIIIALLCIITCTLLSSKCRDFIKFILYKAIQFKWILFAIVVIYQIVVWASFGSVGMGADQEAIKETAQHPQQYSDYLSQCPNNVLITYIYWIVYQIIPESWPANSATLIMQLLTIFSLDISIALMPRFFGKLSSKIANIAFIIALLLLGLSGHIILVYTDIFTLPITLSSIYCMLSLLDANRKINWKSPRLYILSITLGLLTYLDYQMKPSSIIGVLGFVIILIFFCFGKQIISLAIPVIIATALGITAGSAVFNLAINEHMQLNYDSSQAYPMSHFMAMGLRDRGGFSPEDRADARMIHGKEAKNQYSINLVKQRLSDYGPIGYSSFILRKANYTLSDGTFSFGRFDSMYQYHEYIDNGILSKFQNSQFAQLIREIYNVDGPKYIIVQLLQQITYIVLILGILLNSVLSFRITHTRYLKTEIMNDSLPQTVSWWLAISILGALLFLMLFESGRSKYLIQFLPIFILYSSIGWSRLMSSNTLKTQNHVRNFTDSIIM